MTWGPPSYAFPDATKMLEKYENNSQGQRFSPKSIHFKGHCNTWCSYTKLHQSAVVFQLLCEQTYIQTQEHWYSVTSIYCSASMAINCTDSSILLRQLFLQPEQLSKTILHFSPFCSDFGQRHYALYCTWVLLMSRNSRCYTGIRWRL